MADLVLLALVVASFVGLLIWVLVNPETREHVFSTRDEVRKDPVLPPRLPMTMPADPRD